ncbi:hypothetical protein IWW43_000287 [Coemansia sp. RSA 1935]|nr:hypothetical protein IWW43_000287 [Coemansia sp. RSA 1935]
MPPKSVPQPVVPMVEVEFASVDGSGFESGSAMDAVSVTAERSAGDAGSASDTGHEVDDGYQAFNERLDRILAQGSDILE